MVSARVVWLLRVLCGCFLVSQCVAKKNLKPTAHVSDTPRPSLGAYGVGQLLHGAGDYSELIWPGLLRLQVAVDIGSQFLKVSAEQSVRGATRASAGDHAQRTPATLRVP